MYVPPYIEGLKELELVAFGFGIFLLVAVIILLTKTKSILIKAESTIVPVYLEFMEGENGMASLGSGPVLLSVGFIGFFSITLFVRRWLASDVVVVPSLLPSILTEASSTFMCLCLQSANDPTERD